MNRLLALVAVGVATALATWAVRTWLDETSRRASSPPRRALDTWENEGGNFALYQAGAQAGARPLQQQLG
jgi:hypothetical protein